MKKLSLFLILICLLTLCSCSKSQQLEGNWKTIALNVNGTTLPLTESNIKFVRNGKTYTAKGCAGVNLYNADIKVKGKTFRASNMENTGFMGTPEEMAFEDNFFEALMNADSCHIEDSILRIYNQSLMLELKLKKD